MSDQYVSLRLYHERVKQVHSKYEFDKAGLGRLVLAQIGLSFLGLPIATTVLSSQRVASCSPGSGGSGLVGLREGYSRPKSRMRFRNFPRLTSSCRAAAETFH